LRRRIASRLCISRALPCAVAAALPIFASTLLARAAGVAPAASQEAMSSQSGPYAQPPAPPPLAQEPPLQAAPADAAQTPSVPPNVSHFDKALFQRPIPSDQMTFLTQFNGAPSNDLYRDKEFRKLMHSFVPDCMFHYGSDKPLWDALDEVIKGSKTPVEIREGRYVMLSGSMGPFLAGKGFLWIDMQDGIGLGGFYFHPTNGEPTPTVNVFSKQVLKEDFLSLSQLPPGFIEDLNQWSYESRLPEVTTRYFLTGSNKKILLEHDEDYCAPLPGAAPTNMPAPSGCEELDAQAVDLDMDAAYYLDQIHHATNGTAWMITGADQVAFLQVRASSCGGVLDPLGCRIRMTREHTRGIVTHGSAPHPGGRR
jgi:hypothetical protein